MEKSTRVCDRKWKWVGLGVLVFTLAGLPIAPAETSEVRAVVAKVKGGAWLINEYDGIRSSIQEGQTLRAGDEIGMQGSNYVQLAIDEQGKNVVQIQGSFIINGPQDKNATLELKEGKALAFLNNLDYGERFEISTPTSVASVRGTRLQVETIDRGSKIMSFEGTAKVFGRLPSGHLTEKSVLVNSGQKTYIEFVGGVPRDPEALSDDEWQDYYTDMMFLAEAKEWSSKNAAAIFMEAKTGAPLRESSEPTPKKADKAGRIVF